MSEPVTLKARHYGIPLTVVFGRTVIIEDTRKITLPLPGPFTMWHATIMQIGNLLNRTFN
jgi:hypothetical protein